MVRQKISIYKRALVASRNVVFLKVAFNILTMHQMDMCNANGVVCGCKATENYPAVLLSFKQLFSIFQLILLRSATVLGSLSMLLSRKQQTDKDTG